MTKNQNSTPYSIFIENRPIRIAFLVNPKDSNVFKTMESIITYNQGKWGGRFNPIIPTNGKFLTKKWWQFLKEYDPDVIKSYVPINKTLLKRFNNLLTPYLIEDFNPKKNHPPSLVYLGDEGLSVLPTKNNIANVTGFSLERTHLVLFEIDRNKRSNINTFIKINFGAYEPMLTTSKIIRQFPNRKEFVVKKKSDLISALSSLNTFDTFIYPSQMCSFPSHSVSSKYKHQEEAFNIIVGDSLNDLLYYWNRALSINDFRQQKLNGIWINQKMATDPKIIKALNAWIKRAVDPGGSQNKDVRFVSFSLKKKELEDIAAKILDKTFFRKSVATYRQLIIPDISRNSYLPPIKERLQTIRATGEEAHLSVPLPEIMKDSFGGQYWMTDVFIEFRPERFPYIQGINYWWQLPKHNDIALSMFNKPARIMGNGIPSVLLQRNSIDKFPKNKIVIDLLDDARLFRIIFMGDKRPVYTSDPRANLVKRPYGDIARSDKGRYLTGIIDLFGYLYYAMKVFESRFWRNMFQKLSHQNPKKNIVRRKATINKLKKNLTKRNLASEDGIEWLTDYVLELSKQEAVFKKDLPYEDFEKSLKEEIDEYNESRKKGDKHTVDKEWLLREIKNLIESNILLSGVKPQCPLCGTSNWYPLEELKSQVDCKGCGYTFILGPEQKWHYRLNTLVQSGAAQHGLIPVILVLGNLLNDARSSFMFYPSVEMYSCKNGKRSTDELDIACIQDGKLIIGEVKTSNSLFREKDFAKMKKVAEKVIPSKVIFSSMERTESPFIKKQIMALQKQLNKFDIQVEWYSLPQWTFEPRPL